MRLYTGPLLLLLFALSAHAEKSRPTAAVIDDETLPPSMPIEREDKTPEPAPEPEPEPVAEPTAEPQLEPEPQPEPEPEPAADDARGAAATDVFADVSVEDYGDTAESSVKPDTVDNEVIEELVNRFLDTGSAVNNETGGAPVVHHANPAAHALVNSSEYWNIADLEEPGSIKDEEEARIWLEGYATEAQKVLYQVTTSAWRYFTNVNGPTKQALDEAVDVSNRFVRATSLQAKQFDAKSFKDASLGKQLQFLSFEGMSALPGKQRATYTAALSRELSETSICEEPGAEPCLLKRVDLVSMFYNVRNAPRLSQLYNGFAEAVTEKTKDAFDKFIRFSNQGCDRGKNSNSS